VTQPTVNTTSTTVVSKSLMHGDGHVVVRTTRSRWPGKRLRASGPAAWLRKQLEDGPHLWGRGNCLPLRIYVVVKHRVRQARWEEV